MRRLGLIFWPIAPQIKVFYCLALKNEEEIGKGGGRDKEFWPKYSPPKTFFGKIRGV